MSRASKIIPLPDGKELRLVYPDVGSISNNPLWELWWNNSRIRYLDRFESMFIDAALWYAAKAAAEVERGVLVQYLREQLSNTSMLLSNPPKSGAIWAVMQKVGSRDHSLKRGRESEGWCVGCNPDNCPGCGIYKSTECNQEARDFLIEVLLENEGGFKPVQANGIRLTHIPTGISVTESKHKSPFLNRSEAFNKLQGILKHLNSQETSLVKTD